jgi:hypothetical protein
MPNPHFGVYKIRRPIVYSLYVKTNSPEEDMKKLWAIIVLGFIIGTIHATFFSTPVSATSQPSWTPDATPITGLNKKTVN